MLDRFFVVNHRFGYDSSVVWRVVIVQLSANVVIVFFVEVTLNRN